MLYCGCKYTFFQGSKDKNGAGRPVEGGEARIGKGDGGSDRRGSYGDGTGSGGFHGRNNGTGMADDVISFHEDGDLGGGQDILRDLKKKEALLKG